MPRLVVLQVVRSVLEAEVREQALCTHAARELEQIVVRFARIQVDAVLDAENLDREDSRFATAEAFFGRQKQVLHDHAGFGFRAHAIVDARERSLGTGTAVHGVQIVDKRFHGLERCLIRFFVSLLFGKLLGVFHRFCVKSLGKLADFGFPELFVRHERCDHAHFRHFGMELLHDRQNFFFGLARQKHESLDHVRKVSLAVRDANAVCHGVVKVRHRLAAMLVVLVRLNRNSGESRITADILRFAQMTMTRIEAILEQLNKVNLAASHREGIEVQIMDVNVAIHVSTAVFRLEHHHRVEMLCGFRTVLEHRAHGGIAVDVRIFALEVGFLRGTERDVVKRMHEARIDFAHTGAFSTVQDVALGSIGVTTFGQSLFYSILNFFDVRLRLVFGFQVANGFGGNL